MKHNIAKDSAKIDASKESLNDRRNVSSEAISNAINDSEKAVKSKEEQIRNSSDSLKKDVAERADTGTISAARKKVWRTLKKW